MALARVDIERRASVSRSHSATHLLHAGLRRALGDTAAQAGSLNAPGRLRFDFTTPSAVPHSVLGDVEDEINEVLLRDLEVRWFVTDQDEARRLGAIAMFGEKYGERVRIVEIGDYSRELCGGTHVARSSVIGMVKLLGEASIGSGVRRVEALVGLDAFRYLAREHVLVQSLAAEFKAQPDELPERINGVLDRLKSAERELAKLRVGQVLASAGALAGRRAGRRRRAARRGPGTGGRRRQRPALAGARRSRPVACAATRRVVLLASPADGGGVGVRRSGQRGGSGGRPGGRRAGRGCSRPCSVRAAVARPTSPRVPAVTPAKLRRRLRGRPGVLAARDHDDRDAASGSRVDVGTVRVGVARTVRVGVLERPAGILADPCDSARHATTAISTNSRQLVRDLRARSASSSGCRGRWPAGRGNRPKWRASYGDLLPRGSPRFRCDTLTSD